MNRLRILMLWCLFATPACIDLPEIVDPPQEPAPEPPLEVRLSSPGGTLHTNGDVAVQVVVSGGEAEQVELLLGDELLVSLPAPYSYTWPTQGVPEGQYSLRARASRKREQFTSPPRTVVVDRTPPQVVSRSPAPGAQDVSVRAPIRIEFSEPLLRSSVTEASFSVTANGTPVGHSILISDDATGLEVRTNQPPPAPSEVVVSIVANATDLAGNKLVMPVSQWSWRNPAFVPFAPNLSALEGATDAQNPALVVVPGSNDVFAAWKELNGGTSEVYFRRWDGERWAELPGFPQPIEPENRYAPRFILGRTGKLFTGFSAISPGNRVNHVAEWTGSAWKELNPCNVSGPSGLALAVDAQDRPLVGFGESYPGGEPIEEEVHVCRFNGQRWESLGAPRRLEGVNTGPRFFDLQTDPDGNPFVVWTQEKDDWNRAYVEKWNGTDWVLLSPTVSAKDTSSFISSLKLAVGPDAAVYMAWVDSKAGNPDSLYLHRWRGGWQQMGVAITPRKGEP